MGFPASATGKPASMLQDRFRPDAVLERHALLADLRAKVHAIERPAVRLPEPDAAERVRGGWTFGIDALDVALGGGRSMSGLDCGGVHEIKPRLQEKANAASLRAAALGFALRLAVRRVKSVSETQRGSEGVSPFIIWCGSKAFTRDVGALYGPGLIALGLDPSNLLLVETARTADTLWAMEEALRSRVVTLVAGVADSVDLTAARRLSLAAEAGQTPALLLTHGGSPSCAATATRWRVGLSPSARNSLDLRAPGGFAVSAGLERCRAAPALARLKSRMLEWCDETHRFRLPPAVADRADGEWPRSERIGSQRVSKSVEAVRAG